MVTKTARTFLKEQTSWSRKDWRKYYKKQIIHQNKREKKYFRQYQKDTGKSDLFELIPKSSYYCYSVSNEIEQILYNEQGETFPIYKKILCPFWYSIEIPEEERNSCVGIVACGQTYIGGCKILKETDNDMNGWGLLWDQCKECGLNIGRNAL